MYANIYIYIIYSIPLHFTHAMKKSSRTCILFVYVRGFAACRGKNTQMDQATLHGFYSQSQAPHRFKNQQRNKDVDLEKTQNATTP